MSEIEQIKLSEDAQMFVTIKKPLVVDESMNVLARKAPFPEQ
jgi:hypothetical protein